MLLHNGLYIGNAASRYDYKIIESIKSASVSALLHPNGVGYCSADAGLPHVKRQERSVTVPQHMYGPYRSVEFQNMNSTKSIFILI